MKSPFTLFLLSLLALSPVNASERPNVLLIVCDDPNTQVSTSGYSPIQTPNFDRLAAEGTVFRRAARPGPPGATHHGERVGSVYSVEPRTYRINPSNL